VDLVDYMFMGGSAARVAEAANFDGLMNPV